MDWRCPEDYAVCAELRAAEWAWQFLRRNPGYRRDYAWFIATWRDLEAAYGTPPTRDFFRWRQDPRAWRDEAEIAGCGSDVCPGQGGQVLIECWMGAKWGLRKFPPDPDLVRPVLGAVLDWRERPIEAVVADGEISASLAPDSGRIALCFDLDLPLAAQLEAAKRYLVGRRHALERAGRLGPRSVRAGRGQWTLQLRLVDAAEAGASPAEIARILGCREPLAELDAARRMVADGWRRILLLEP